MKKIFSLAIVLAVAAYFVGAQLVLPFFQTVPVTVAAPGSTQSVIPIYAQALPGSSSRVVTSFPAHPVVKEQPVTSVMAAKATTRTGEQALLDQFVKTVSGQGTDQVTGVYVDGRFSLPVVQQPIGDPSYVSTEDGVVTQFGSAGAYGTIGLLAHNFLSGRQFFNLRTGDDVIVVYGSGSQAEYRVSQVQQYQALDPESVYSNFINLSDPNRAQLSADQVFRQVYTTENRLVFQTCIYANGDPSWGRLFVIADKISQ